MLKSTQQALGLYRTPNQLGVAQDGAFVRLDECVIRSKDVVEPRLGQTLVANYIGGNSGDTRRFNSLFQSSVGFLGQYGSGTTSGVKIVDGAATEILTNVSPPSPWVRTRFADCQKRCYMTSDSGIQRIDSSGVGAAAGGLRAKIDTQRSHPVYSTSGFAPVGSACLYRAVFVSFAPDGSEIVGPASNRWYMRVAASQTVAIGSFVRATNVITVTTPAAHNLRVGDSPNFTFDIADTGAGKFTTGTYTIATVPSATSFTINSVAANYSNTVAVAMVAGTAYGKPRILIPSGASISTVVRLFRSEVATTGATATPSDDVYEVFEAYLTSTNISNGYIEVSDNTPEVLLGDPSYFSPSVEGESGSNEPPPLCWDLCSMGDVLMGANLTFQHQLEIRLLATGGSSGPDGSGGALVIERTGYTTIEPRWQTDIDVDAICVYAGGTVARDIEATALGICDCINTFTGNNWLDAFYVSGAEDAPGRILLRCRDFNSTAFTAYDATYYAAFAPNIPSSPKVQSKQETDPAGIAFSKPGQPDSFPVFQRSRCGPSSEKALRILPVREKVIALKEGSAWLISGAWPSYRVDLLDNICGFHLPDTAAVLDNQVFALSSIGVVAVSEAGVSLMGTPIEGDTREVSEQAARVNSLLAAGTTPPCLAAWGAADTLEHRYLLALPSPLGAQSANVDLRTSIIWVYQAGQKAWCGPWKGDWRHAARWLSSSSSSRLAFALQSHPAIAKENGLDTAEAQRHADYFGHTVYVSAKSGNSLTLLSGSGGDPDATGLQVGDCLYNSTTGYPAIITSITSEDLGTVTVDDASGVSTSTTLKALRGYESIAEWVPQHLGTLPADSQLHTAVLALSDQRFTTATVRASSELSGAEQDAKTLNSPGFGVDLIRDATGNLADAGFGAEPFGHIAPLKRERVQIPRDVQRGGFHSIIFRVKEAGAYWRLHGLSLEFEAQSGKGIR